MGMGGATFVGAQPIATNLAYPLGSEEEGDDADGPRFSVFSARSAGGIGGGGGDGGFQETTGATPTPRARAYPPKVLESLGESGCRIGIAACTKAKS